MKALTMRAAASDGEKGPRPPNSTAASVATSLSSSYQPVTMSRVASPISGVDHPAAIISWRTRT